MRSRAPRPLYIHIYIFSRNNAGTPIPRGNYDKRLLGETSRPLALRQSYIYLWVGKFFRPWRVRENCVRAPLFSTWDISCVGWTSYNIYKETCPEQFDTIRQVFTTLRKIQKWTYRNFCFSENCDYISSVCLWSNVIANRLERNFVYMQIHLEWFIIRWLFI